MSHTRFAWAVAATTALLVPTVCPAQVTLGQIDTFPTTSTMNWSQGASAAPGSLTVVPGGPGGAADNFLQITADAAGSSRRLTMFNQTQWAGNYPTAGVNAIEMDLRAPAGATQPLSMRIAFRDPGFAGSGYSSAPFVLSDANWHHVTFLLTAANFTPVNNPATPFGTYISSVVELRLLHSTAPSVTGDQINAVVGVDNIRASPVPEPGTAFAVGAGAFGLVTLGRRVKRAIRDAG